MSLTEHQIPSTSITRHVSQVRTIQDDPITVTDSAAAMLVALSQDGASPSGERSFSEGGEHDQANSRGLEWSTPNSTPTSSHGGKGKGKAVRSAGRTDDEPTMTTNEARQEAVRMAAQIDSIPAPLLSSTYPTLLSFRLATMAYALQNSFHVFIAAKNVYAKFTEVTMRCSESKQGCGWSVKAKKRYVGVPEGQESVIVVSTQGMEQGHNHSCLPEGLPMWAKVDSVNDPSPSQERQNKPSSDHSIERSPVPSSSAIHPSSSSRKRQQESGKWRTSGTDGFVGWGQAKAKGIELAQTSIIPMPTLNSTHESLNSFRYTVLAAAAQQKFIMKVVSHVYAEPDKDVKATLRMRCKVEPCKFYVHGTETGERGGVFMCDAGHWEHTTHKVEEARVLATVLGGAESTSVPEGEKQSEEFQTGEEIRAEGSSEERQSPLPELTQVTSPPPSSVALPPNPPPVPSPRSVSTSSYSITAVAQTASQDHAMIDGMIDRDEQELQEPQEVILINEAEGESSREKANPAAPTPASPASVNGKEGAHDRRDKRPRRAPPSSAAFLEISDDEEDADDDDDDNDNEQEEPVEVDQLDDDYQPANAGRVKERDLLPEALVDEVVPRQLAGEVISPPQSLSTPGFSHAIEGPIEAEQAAQMSKPSQKGKEKASLVDVDMDTGALPSVGSLWSSAEACAQVIREHAGLTADTFDVVWCRPPAWHLGCTLHRMSQVHCKMKVKLKANKSKRDDNRDSLHVSEADYEHSPGCPRGLAPQTSDSREGAPVESAAPRFASQGSGDPTATKRKRGRPSAQQNKKRRVTMGAPLDEESMETEVVPVPPRRASAPFFPATGPSSLVSIPSPLLHPQTDGTVNEPLLTDGHPESDYENDTKPNTNFNLASRMPSPAPSSTPHSYSHTTFVNSLPDPVTYLQSAATPTRGLAQIRLILQFLSPRTRLADFADSFMRAGFRDGRDLVSIMSDPKNLRKDEPLVEGLKDEGLPPMEALFFVNAVKSLRLELEKERKGQSGVPSTWNSV